MECSFFSSLSSNFSCLSWVVLQGPLLSTVVCWDLRLPTMTACSCSRLDCTHFRMKAQRKESWFLIVDPCHRMPETVHSVSQLVSLTRVMCWFAHLFLFLFDLLARWDKYWALYGGTYMSAMPQNQTYITKTCRTGVYSWSIYRPN